MKNFAEDGPDITEMTPEQITEFDAIAKKSIAEVEQFYAGTLPPEKLAEMLELQAGVKRMLDAMPQSELDKALQNYDSEGNPK